ncbi:MAG: O-antigen ligase family protein, partial [Candidatus Gastranaerophilales bacterium]|nr:O-antigen ligase family protein [Candidatus Gastranaerophilales bacterium]
FVIISLAGSSLFLLSLKGILKTFIYLLFYFSAAYYLSFNKKKIFPVILLIMSVCSFEAVIGIIQNLTHIDQIATWQDSSNLKDSSHLISRAYGTLIPYNPNLLAGYLVAGLSSVFMFLLYSLSKKNKPGAIFFSFLFLTFCYAIFATGSRGAYLGLFGFFAVIIAYIFILFKKYRLHCAIVTGVIAAGIFLIPSFCARIFSIFSMRGDSSISFRMNVYQASFKMFLDNIFLGIGVGNSNFREIYGLYMKTGFDALGAYSVPLEIAVESGIFALLSFIFYISLVIIKSVRYTLNGSIWIVNRIIIFSVLLTICAVMFHGFFDTVFFRPQIQIIFWINMAIFYALTLER